MRTIVELPDDQVKALDSLGKKENLSRAELVRRAVKAYVENKRGKTADTVDKYYGFLKGTPDAFEGMDGLAYQQKMRGEWDERDTAYGKWGMQDKAGPAYEHPKNKDKEKP